MPKVQREAYLIVWGTCSVAQSVGSYAGRHLLNESLDDRQPSNPTNLNAELDRGMYALYQLCNHTTGILPISPNLQPAGIGFPSRMQ